MDGDNPEAAEFAEFARRNASWIKNLTRRMARRLNAELDDVRQDFFVWLLKKWAKYYDPARGAESTYLTLEARSMVDFAERFANAQKRRVRPAQLDDVETEHLAGRGPSVPDRCAEREARAMLRAAVEALPVRLRSVVDGQMGFRDEQMAHKALGERMGLSRSRVQQLAESAFELLLDEHFPAVTAAREALM
jgi:RNA polymerase sigma factor (sigma-70 family)